MTDYTAPTNTQASTITSLRTEFQTLDALIRKLLPDGTAKTSIINNLADLFWSTQRVVLGTSSVPVSTTSNQNAQ